MPRKSIEWAGRILELGGPAVFAFSSLLPGLPGLGGGIPFVKEIWEALINAEAHIKRGEYEEARKCLERADALVENLCPHTPSFEEISKFKTYLWELVSVRQ